MYIKNEKHEEEEIGEKNIQRILFFFFPQCNETTSDKMVPVCDFTGVTEPQLWRNHPKLL